MTLGDIKSFEEKYKGSEEETEDLKSAYLKYEGDMDHIMTEVKVAGGKNKREENMWPINSYTVSEGERNNRVRGENV